jgi:PAS domain S-box-containing protein
MDREQCVLILAPTGRDAAISLRFLTESNLHAVTCNSVQTLSAELQEGCGVILLAGEALTTSSFQVLAGAVTSQPSWSDVPLIVLTSGGGAYPANAGLLSQLGEVSNMTLIERPVRAATLLSAIKSALRARQHQYAVRDQLAEEIRVKEALRNSEERLHIALDAAQLGAWERNLATGQVEGTAICRRNFGLSLDEPFTYEVLLNLIHPDDRSVMEQAVKKALTEHVSYKCEYRVIWPDNSVHWILAHGRANYDSDGIPYDIVGVTLDITDSKRAEAEREQLLASEQAARVEAEAASRLKDQFLATVSHELRTPLMAIMGWANLLRADLVDENSVATALETIERNANSQMQLINDLLDVSRIISGKMRLEVEDVEVTSVIMAAIEAIRPAAVAKNVKLQVSISPQPILMRADPERLQQIAWNLLSNAVKFTPEGGQIHTALAVKDKRIELKVSDNGRGIAPEFLSHVFGRFRQADQTSTRTYGGLGLGLSIVLQLVELHGGSISADSEGEGRGATFTVYLPLAANEPDNILGHDSPVIGKDADGTALQCPSHLKDLRVLVVDDEPDTRAMLKTTLELCGSIVYTAASVSEATEIFTQFEPDILVSDIGLPNENGYALIAKIRSIEASTGKTIPAMALTAYVAEEDRLQAIDAGFQMHVAKPVEAGEFISLLSDLVQRS